MRMLALFLAPLLTACAATSPAEGTDTYEITLDPSARDEPATGRIVLFFITEHGPMWDGRAPVEGPFFQSPQPIASIAVENLKPGDTVVIDGNSAAFPGPLDELDGEVRVQAVLDADQTERSFLVGPGNVISDAQIVRLSRDRADHITIHLTRRIEKQPTPPDQPNLKWVRLRSELLSEFYGRDVYHRAGVALPNGYNDPARAGQSWPVVYVIPGFGGRDDAAAGYAEMLSLGDLEFTPQAVFIVLDPESPLGHHGFVDSLNHGPRSTALVKELIPHLENRFRLHVAREGRVLYGHSSGGWTALWLQLNWPEVFGGCWSSGPDPIDFSRFQFSNLYKDRNLFEFAPGNETPSYRVVDLEGRDMVSMTVRQESGMEYALDPDGRSGEQWDAWEAMFSPRDSKTGLPRAMFDPRTGEIDREVVEHWKQFDVYEMVRDDWDHFAPILDADVRILCGEFDNFYLNRAVENFRQFVELRSGGTHSGSGYIEIVRDGSHNNLVALTTVRIHKEMIAHFQKYGLPD